MTSLADSSSSSSTATATNCLPPLRCALAGQTSPTSSSTSSYRHDHQVHLLPSFSTISGSCALSSSAAEEDDALPLLMSMAQIQTKAAAVAVGLPTISSLMSSVAAAAADRSSSSSPVPQSSPPSPSTLSPGLFTGSSSSSSCSSSMSMSSASALSPSLFTTAVTSPSLAASSHYHHQHAAFNNLMELSDIISSTQKLPVPMSLETETETKHEQSRQVVDSGDDEFDESVSAASSDSDAMAQWDSPPVSSRTRRVTRNQQKQIDRIKSEIELERERARELEQTLQLALRERTKLLATGTQAAARQPGGGQVSFFNVLNATADGSQPLVLVDLPRSHSLPSAPAGEISDASRPSSEGRSRSAPMLPPIASIPGLSPYLARKRGSLPPPASVGPLRPTVAVAADTAYARGPSRRRKSVDRDDADEDYDPMSGAKKVKRTRSMSERGRRLQGSSGARRRRSETQYHASSGYTADEDDHAGHAAATFMAMRAKAIEEERHVRESRLMDVVEGADQEDDVDAEYHHRAQQQHRQARVATGAHARRDSVLDFIKEHPHASFWLKARN